MTDSNAGPPVPVSVVVAAASFFSLLLPAGLQAWVAPPEPITPTDCPCLQEYVENSARILTPEIMEAIAASFGGEEVQVLFDPEQDYGGPYAFEWVTGGFSLEEGGVTYSVRVSSNAALRSLRSREQLEGDAFLLEDLGLEPGEGLLRALAQTSFFPAEGEAELQEVEGLGDYAVFHEEDGLLNVVCGDVLMQIQSNAGIPSFTGVEVPESQVVGSPLAIGEALAEALLEGCP